MESLKFNIPLLYGALFVVVLVIFSYTLDILYNKNQENKLYRSQCGEDYFKSVVVIGNNDKGSLLNITCIKANGDKYFIYVEK